MKTRRQSGFTLIELILVIVILSILAATALPKFADFKSDANKAKLSGAAAAVQSASAMAHGKYLVTLPAPATAVFEGVTVSFINGYADAASMAAAAGLTATDFTLITTATTLTVSPSGVTTPASCQLVYMQAGATNPPIIAIVSTNCS